MALSDNLPRWWRWPPKVTRRPVNAAASQALASELSQASVEVISPEADTVTSAEELLPQVKSEIRQGRAKINSRVDSLKALTEREILACGNVLATIVETVKRLMKDSDSAVADSMARSDELTKSFISDMQQDIQTQEQAVAQVLALTDGIEDAIKAMSRLSEYSNILALNSKIEAARIGEHGAGFVAIADHIRELSQTIQATASKVSTSIGAVRQGLPPVLESATSMHERTSSFITEVAEQVKSASLHEDGDGSRLDVVMALSNEALSHLQFQDSLAQKLGAIDQDVDQLGTRICSVLGGETPSAYTPEETAAENAEISGKPDDNEPLPGQIILF